MQRNASAISSSKWYISVFKCLIWYTFKISGRFLLFLLISNILQFIMSTIVLRLHQNEQCERPVSSGIQTFTRKVLVCLSCVCCCRSKLTEDDYSKQMMQHVKFTMPRNTRVSPSKIAKHRGQNEGDRVKSATSTRSISDIFTRASSGSESTSSSTTCLIEHDYGWVEIAEMLDRIFLWISLLVFTSLTCIFVPILYAWKYSKNRTHPMLRS